MKNGGTKSNKYEAFMGKADLTIKDVVKGLRINLSASRKADYYMENTVKRALFWRNWKGGQQMGGTYDKNSYYKNKIPTKTCWRLR